MRSWIARPIFAAFAAALAQAVPLLCIPGAGADQPVIAVRVEALGAGQMISPDANASQTRGSSCLPRKQRALQPRSGTGPQLIGFTLRGPNKVTGSGVGASR